MFGKTEDKQTYRFDVHLSIQSQGPASPGYLSVNQSFNCGPLGLKELGEILARVAGALEAP